MSESTHEPLIVCLGETMVMVTPCEPVSLREADMFRLSVGGAESTVALYLSEMGHDVAWASRVGADLWTTGSLRPWNVPGSTHH